MGSHDEYDPGPLAASITLESPGLFASLTLWVDSRTFNRLRALLTGIRRKDDVLEYPGIRTACDSCQSMRDPLASCSLGQAFRNHAFDKLPCLSSSDGNPAEIPYKLARILYLTLWSRKIDEKGRLG